MKPDCETRVCHRFDAFTLNKGVIREKRAERVSIVAGVIRYPRKIIFDKLRYLRFESFMRWMKREEGKVSIVEFVDKLLNLLRKVIVFSILNRNTTRQDIDRLKLRNYRVSYRREEQCLKSYSQFGSFSAYPDI